MKIFIKALLLGFLVFLLFRTLYLLQKGQNLLVALTASILIPIQIIATTIGAILNPSRLADMFNATLSLFMDIIFKPFSMSQDTFWDRVEKIISIPETVQDNTPAKVQSPTGGETAPHNDNASTALTAASGNNWTKL